MMMSEAHTIMLEQIEGTRSVNALPSALIELHKFVERTARRAQAADKEGTSVDEEIQKSFANFMHCMVKVVQVKHIVFQRRLFGLRFARL